MLRADVSEPATLRALAEHARVVATTVGPYVLYGEDLVAACADTGTDYLDLTGEPEFVDLTYVRHDARARETGARLVHACGFDSVPHDLGVYFTVRQLPEGVPLTVDGYVTVDAAFSGGTLASALNQFARGPQLLAAARERRRRRAAPDRAPDHGGAGRAGVRRGGRRVGAAAADRGPADRAPLGQGPRPVRPRLPLPALRGGAAAAGGSGRGRRRRRGAGGRPTAARAALVVG